MVMPFHTGLKLRGAFSVHQLQCSQHAGLGQFESFRFLFCFRTPIVALAGYRIREQYVGEVCSCQGSGGGGGGAPRKRSIGGHRAAGPER